MIGISTRIYDIAGARIFRADPAEERANIGGGRRVTRHKTLDGGVAVYDTGYADGDRTLLATEPDADQEAVAFARYIVETYSLVAASLSDGCYLGVPESYWIADDGTLNLRILVTEKLSD